MNSTSSSGGLVNSNNNDDSGSNNFNDNCNSCLKSFCIYCPSLSGWKEERAMDNILFFFPPHTQKSAQMNHVGFCIGASCLAERFAAVMPVNEIRTSHGIISLCCPFPDLWIVVEVTAVYDSSVVLPIIRLGFDAFVLRYGHSTITALVSTDGSHTIEEVNAARASLKLFFEKFTLFLQTRVFVLDIRQAVDMSICTFLSPQSSSSSTLGGSRNRNSNRMANVRRCKRRWAAVANAESLLAFPVFIRVSPQAVQFMCHSLIYRQLSLFLTELSQSNGGHGSSSSNNSHNNNNNSGSNNKKSCTTGWGQEYQGITTSINLSELNKTAEERLVWTCCKYIVFAEETLKVIVSNASHKLVSQFISLLLIEADLSNFTTFVDNEIYNCYVCRSSGVIMVLLVNNNLVSSSTHDIISLTCRVITDDIGEYLATGSCTFLREGYQGPVEIQRMTLGPFINTIHSSNSGDSPTNSNTNTNYNTTMGTVSFFSAPPEFPKLRDTKLTFQWTVWNDGMIIGSPMREYPRVVHLLMSSIMRTVIQRISDVNSRSGRREDGVNKSHLENSTPYISLSSYEENFNTVDNTLIRRSNSTDAIVEIWTPLHGASWLCVTQQDGRVGGIVFYNCASLKSCFEAVSELRQYMSLLV